jgi:hypothetical protein
MPQDMRDWAKRKAGNSPPPAFDDDDEGGAEDAVDLVEPREPWIKALADDHPLLASWLTKLGDAIGSGDLERVKELWGDPPADDEAALKTPTPPPSLPGVPKPGGITTGAGG